MGVVQKNLPGRLSSRGHTAWNIERPARQMILHDMHWKANIFFHAANLRKIRQVSVPMLEFL